MYTVPYMDYTTYLLIKTAKDKLTPDILAELQPHQRKAVERALKNNLILAHSTGSGKTLTSIAIADALQRPATVLTPASLVENYKKEIANFKNGGPAIEVLSLPTAQLRNYQVPKGNTLIIDEMHSLRNPKSKKYKYIKKQLENADRVFGLTGTPAYNNIENWAPLVNVVAKQDVFPIDPSEFKHRYTTEEKVHKYSPFIDYLIGVSPGSKTVLKNKEELKEKLKNYVDVFEADIAKPKRIDETVKVPMSKEQEDVYNFVEGKDVPWSIRLKMLWDLPPSKREAKSLNSYLSGVRQVANTDKNFNINADEISPKMQAALDSITEKLKKNPELRAFVYSNYLDSGVTPISKKLTEKGISNAIFHGGLSQKEKKKLVDLYNSGKLHVLLGTGSASEGLDLKQTNLLQILEPHFNNAKLEQVIGRGIRYKSHDALPPSKRKVLVQKFESTHPRSWWDKLLGKEERNTVDGYLTARAAEKDELINQVKELFR